MLVSAALCPHPPMLLPGLTGTVDVAHDLRAHCLDAVRGLLDAGPDVVVVVGGADRGGVWPADSAPATSAYRGRPTAGAGLPLSISVGVHLLDLAGWSGRRVLHAVAHDETTERCLEVGRTLVAGDGGDPARDGEAVGPQNRVALLALGDGSARRGPKAPGYLDPAAVPFDDGVLAALAGPDVAALAALDPEQATGLLAQGRAAWQVLAGAMPMTAVDGAAMTAADGVARSAGQSSRPWQGGVLHAEDPFGVLYVVAAWRPAR